MIHLHDAWRKHYATMDQIFKSFEKNILSLSVWENSLQTNTPMINTEHAIPGMLFSMLYY
jgi:hypothetical protein